MQHFRLKRGKPRETGDRYPCGQLKHKNRGETPEEIRRVAESQPHRRHQAKPSDPLHGYALGRLRVAGMGDKGDGISQRQHDAGWTWAELHLRHSHLQGFQIPNLPSPTMQVVSRGLSCAPDPDDEVISRVRRRWADAAEAVTSHVGPRGLELLKQVCVCDRDPGPQEIGVLRMALNALAHLWRT